MGMLTPLAIRIGAIAWMPKLLPQITWLDKQIQRSTRGRWSILRIAGLPNLMLTVKGRKSGAPRTTPLLCVPYEKRLPDRWLVLRRADDSDLGGERPRRGHGNGLCARRVACSNTHRDR